jgi:hypothetical protein
MQMIDSSLDECLAGVLAVIGGAAGRPETGFARRWRGLQIAKWAAAATMFAGYLAFTLTTMQPAWRRHFEIREPDFRRKVLIFGGVLAALGVYAVVAMGIMLLAPRRFLETDPRGVRAMARLGTKDVSTMRFAAFLLAAVGIALIWGAIHLYRNP